MITHSGRSTSLHTWEFPTPEQAGVGLSPSEWSYPLLGVAEAVLRLGIGDQFDPGDFQIGPRLIRPGKANIHLYKHTEIGTYLNVDTRGRTYRFIPPASVKSGSYGRYVLHRDLADALVGLTLWAAAKPARPNLVVVRGGRVGPRRGRGGFVGPAA